NHWEQAYLDLLRHVLECGEPREDRTGTGTLSVFGRQLRFDISDCVPVLTTKKVAWQKVIQELLWFMRGDTDAAILQRDGVRVWDGNSSRAFLDARGLRHLPEGDIGAGYGHQWRRFGSPYVDCKTPPRQGAEAGGVDQLQFVLDELRRNPSSRRIFMSAWNPCDLDKMALPPCHVSAQFYADRAGGLSCHMYQRSVDVFLGFPWNILSYSVLTYILAAKAGLKPKELIISTGDTHIYANHVGQVRTQLARQPFAWPRLELSPAVAAKAFEDITLEDFRMVGYTSHPYIRADMSV
ncbi:hypothetical protein VOLCADRAFT_68527, partial [Volvox carteri f. nagariensis]